MKKTYFKPAMTVVQLQHPHQLLAGSPFDTVNTNLNGEEDIDISETFGSIWGR